MEDTDVTVPGLTDGQPQGVDGCRQGHLRIMPAKALFRALQRRFA